MTVAVHWGLSRFLRRDRCCRANRPSRRENGTVPLTARRGTTILETLVAGTLLGTLLVVSLQMLSAATGQRHAADQRQCAIVELGNIMERIAARPWAELTSASVAEERLPPSANSQLPGAELKIEIVTDDNESNAKRITASLRWPDSSGQLIAPLTLTTWKYRIHE